MDKIRKINRWLIAFVILLQPEIDIIRMFGGADFELFGFSLIELVNILLIGTIFLLTVITYSEKKKLLKWLWVIPIYIAYFILHYYNITKFNNSVFPEQTINVITEFYCIFRVFILPLVLIFSAYYSGIKKKELFQILQLFVLLIASSIVLINIFEISFFTYDNGLLARYTIFDWFTFSGSNYQSLATKGWFYSGNQISAIMFITLPIILYLAYNKGKIYDYFVLIIQIIAMLMLGTKVANVGCVLILIVFIVIIFFKRIILKKDIKPIKFILFILLGTCILFVFSPRGYEIRHKDVQENTTTSQSILVPKDDSDKISELQCSNLSNKDKMYLDYFMFKNQYKLRMPAYFIDAYKIKYNYTYWCYNIKGAIDFKYDPIDYREMKSAMLKQVYILNNNKLDNLVGMGYTLNFIYTEEDYTFQFYLYGIIGLILFIGPYFMILLYSLIKFFRHFKKNFTILNTMTILSLTIGLVVPYLSGHIFERSFPLYTLAFIAILNLVIWNKDDLEKSDDSEKLDYK